MLTDDLTTNTNSTVCKAQAQLQLPNPDTDDEEDPEDILNTALGILYDYTPITLADAGKQLIYTHPHASRRMRSSIEDEEVNLRPITLVLSAPHTEARNWTLHASSIWASAVFLANHIDELELPVHLFSDPTADSGGAHCFQILELGAGAGLPGLVVAKYLERIHHLGDSPVRDWRVTLSDYPDDMLISGLRNNVVSNGFHVQEKSFSCDIQHGPERVLVQPYAWGGDTSQILSRTEGYDLILAADTLWNAASHGLFVDTLARLLRPSLGSRIHIIAGFHTGRYVISAFIRTLGLTRRVFPDGTPMCLQVARMEEREVNGEGRRSWDEGREDDEVERRRWIVWSEIHWTEPPLGLS